MTEAAVRHKRKKDVGWPLWPLVVALAALALLAPAEASAQIVPQPTANDYCSDRSAPSGKFVAPNGGLSYLNISFADSTPGSVAAAMYGTSAECIQTQPAACPPNCRLQVQAVCEFHCQHDHTAPYGWTVQLSPMSGYLLAWGPGTTCLPAKGAPQSSCVVQMPTSGEHRATARFGSAPDSSPPSPAPAATVSSVGSYALTVSWTPSGDDNWLGGYDIYDGATLLRRVAAGTTSARLEALRCQTTYNLRVVAFDVRNSTSSSTVQATTGRCLASADTRAPNTVFHVKPPRTTRSRTAFFHWGATERSRFRCKLDRGAWRKCRRSDPYATSMGKTYRRLARGSHTFRVRAVDRAGNVDRTPAVWRWRIR